MFVCRGVGASSFRPGLPGIGAQKLQQTPAIRRRTLTVLLTTAAMLTAGAPVLAGDEAKLSALTGAPSNEELIRKLIAMEQRVQALEKQLKQKQAEAGAAGPQAPTAPANAKPANGA